MLDIRYLNSIAAKYLFRADRISEASKMAARFTRDGEQANNLYDMQCTWYEIECGSAHLRRDELGQVRCLSQKALGSMPWLVPSCRSYLYLRLY